MPFMVVSLALSDGCVFMTFAQSSDSDLRLDLSLRYGGRTPYVIEATVTANRVSMNSLTSKLAIVWLDGTTIKYKEAADLAITALTALSQSTYPTENSFVGPFEV